MVDFYGGCREIYHIWIPWEKHLALVVDFSRSTTGWILGQPEMSTQTVGPISVSQLASLTQMQNGKSRVIVSNEFGKSV